MFPPRIWYDPSCKWLSWCWSGRGRSPHADLETLAIRGVRMVATLRTPGILLIFVVTRLLYGVGGWLVSLTPYIILGLAGLEVGRLLHQSVAGRIERQVVLVAPFLLRREPLIALSIPAGWRFLDLRSSINYLARREVDRLRPILLLRLSRWMDLSTIRVLRDGIPRKRRKPPARGQLSLRLGRRYFHTRLSLSQRLMREGAFRVQRFLRRRS
jgi:hypothetical protein